MQIAPRLVYRLLVLVKFRAKTIQTYCCFAGPIANRINLVLVGNNRYQLMERKKALLICSSNSGNRPSHQNNVYYQFVLYQAVIWKQLSSAVHIICYNCLSRHSNVQY
jgi:hypothetical protein